MAGDLEHNVRDAIVQAIGVLHVYDRIHDQRTAETIEKLLAIVRRDHPGEVQVMINGSLERR